MRAISLKILLLSVLCLSSCMQHNGNIGDWFGTWHLQAITVDGVEDAAYEGNYFFQFQTDKVRLSEVAPSGYPDLLDECFGRWKQEGNTLTLDFSHTSNSGSYWTPMAGTYLEKGVNILEINTISSKNLTLTLHSPSTPGTITYSLRKQ